MKCARTACNREAREGLKHKDTGKGYCVPCARKINEYTPGMIPWPDTDTDISRGIYGMRR